MAVFKLLLLPGDGIGPEVMAEVEPPRRLGQRAGDCRDRDRDRPCRRLRLRCAWRGDLRRHHGQGACRRRGDAWRRRRAEMGWCALRSAARGRAAAPAQGLATLRQSAPGHLLSGARRRFVVEARPRRGPRHHDRARADRRGLFRRAEGDQGSRQRAEARRRHPDLRHLRDRAHRRGRLRPRPQAAEPRALGREAQRHEDRRALERGGHAAAQGALRGRATPAHPRRQLRACSSCAGPSSST